MAPPVELPRAPGFGLTGRRALVTGAGRGIGLACAAALAEHGAHVTLTARTGTEIEAAAAAIVARGGQAEALVLDVTDTAATRAAIEAAEPFDILVNNAGTNRPKPAWEVTTGDYDAVMELNVKAAVFVAQAVAQKLMAAGKPGSLIHMSSQMGHVGGPKRTLYCASKWALEGFSKALALDLAPHAIRSNTVCPTFIETPMTRPFFEDKAFLEQVLAKIKLGRLGRVEDVMGAVIYLASDAASLVTGTALLVDGGWTAD